MKNKLLQFGEKVKGISYPVLNEREVRGSSGIMLVIGLIAFVNGFILRNFEVLPYLIGFLLVNFIIGIISAKFAPTMIFSRFFVSKQVPIYIGAIQKRFAWSLGALLTGIAFIISIKLNITGQFFPYFPMLCLLCLLCLFLIFFETAFGICFGCKLYNLALKLKLMKTPKVRPNCIGDSCKVK